MACSIVFSPLVYVQHLHSMNAGAAGSPTDKIDTFQDGYKSN